MLNPPTELSRLWGAQSYVASSAEAIVQWATVVMLLDLASQSCAYLNPYTVDASVPSGEIDLSKQFIVHVLLFVPVLHLVCSM